MQAECHIHAIATATGRPIPLTTTINRSQDRAEQSKARLPSEWTTGMLYRGCHINGIGTYTPDMEEVPACIVDRFSVLIDMPEARDVGDLKNIAPRHPVTLLGDALQDSELWLAHYRETAPMFDCTLTRPLVRPCRMS
jgi:hypothetical protein